MVRRAKSSRGCCDIQRGALVLLAGVGLIAVPQLMHFAFLQQHWMPSVAPLSNKEELDRLQSLATTLYVPAESPFEAVRRLALQSPGLGNELAAEQQAPGAPLFFPAEGPLDALASRGLVGDADEEAAAEAAAEGEAACMDVHPNADSPNMLHVVYASDNSQVEGVQASVASVVAASASPEELTVHILVQKGRAEDFKAKFGIRPECLGTVTVTGVLVRLHALDASDVQRAMAHVTKKVLKERGAIDSLENFARFYMHMVLEPTIVIYLDADTIVQADLAKLRASLLASNKTIGFVGRDGVRMDKFLKRKKSCSQSVSHIFNMTRAYGRPAYNVGVFAVDLKRWAEQRVTERVESLVTAHNNCEGGLWIGGSQPPLLLAFLSRPRGMPDDYVVFDKSWNHCDLGWRTGMKVEKLQKKYVLHWNGNQKPWKQDGLYKELWTPHREKFSSLLAPYKPAVAQDPEAPKEAPKDQAQGKKSKKTTTTRSPEEVSAQEACPDVVRLDDWTPSEAVCKMGSTYGCLDSGKSGMWAGNNCTGVFQVSGKVTACGGEGAKRSTTCEPGALPKPTSKCGIMIMTTFFTQKKDWQRGKYTKPGFGKIRKLYKTVLQNGLNVSVMYDFLPEDVLQKFTCDQFQFVKVDLSKYDKRYGVNDVRYFIFEDLVKEHKDWKTVFIVDAFDVLVGKNPCPDVANDMLYVGHEKDKLKNHPWMKARYSKMGGKYNKWYKHVNDNMKILNCGITGGRRDIMLKLLARMREVLRDPEIKVIKSGNESINLNMAALNYILYTEFGTSNNGKPQFRGNEPVHSRYKRWELERKDVWFIHK